MKKKIEDYKDTSCGHSDAILQNLNKIKQVLKNQNSLNSAIILDLINDTRSHTLKVKNCGKRMEKRLNIYREGIENLGFTRVQK